MPKPWHFVGAGDNAFRLRELGGEQAQMITHAAIDPDHNGYLNYVQLMTYLDGRQPAGSLSFIDWEGWQVWKPPKRRGTDVRMAALLVRGAWRDQRVGFYGIDTRPWYQSQRDGWGEWTKNAMRTVADLVDVWMPSLYLYADNVDNASAMIATQFQWIREVSMKPIIPWVYHRLEPSKVQLNDGMWSWYLDEILGHQPETLAWFVFDHWSLQRGELGEDETEETVSELVRSRAAIIAAKLNT